MDKSQAVDRVRKVYFFLVPVELADQEVKLHGFPHAIISLQSFGIWYCTIFLDPNFLLLTSELRRNQSIDLPQTTVRFIHVELPIVSLVSNVRLQSLVNSPGCFVHRGVVVWQVDGNVLDDETNERLVRFLLPAYPHILRTRFDEVDDDVKRRKAYVRIDLGDVLSESLPRRRILEMAFGVEHEPERHCRVCSRLLW